MALVEQVETPESGDGLLDVVDNCLVGRPGRSPAIPAMKRPTHLTLSCGILLALHVADVAAQQADEWTISSEPVVEIGVLDGDPAYVFTSIRAARLLPAGRIVVADRGMSSIRVYDARGVIQATFGRAGDGPGEFRGIGGLSVHPPDTIRVWDSGTFRISTFVVGDSLVGTERFDPNQPGGPKSVLDGFAGYFSNGDVALGWTVPGRGVEGQVSADRTVLGRFSPGGSLKHLLGQGEGLHRIRGSPDPFSPFPHAAVFRDSIIFMNGAEGRIAILDPSGGGVARTIEIGLPRIEVSSAWLALRQKVVETGRESLLERIPFPRLSHTPVLAGMLIDDRRLIWLKVYDPTSDSVYFGPPPGPGGEWLVITPDGESVATVLMPDDVIPLQIKGDRLLGVSRGEFDVERIVIYTLAR